MKRKRSTIIGLVAGFGLALCIGAVATQQILEKEKEVSIDQVPAAVKATLLAEAKGGVIREIEVDTEDGQTVYEAEVIIDGIEVDIQVAADGRLLGKETEDADDDEDGDDDDADDDTDDEDEDGDEELVSIDAIPAAVKATIIAQAGGRKIQEIVKENEDGQVVYEAEVIVDGKEVNIKVSPDGTLLGTEADDEDEDD